MLLPAKSSAPHIDLSRLGGGRVRVMFVRTKIKSEGKWQVQVVESVRSGKTVKQKIVRNIGLACGSAELAKFREIGEAAIVSILNSRNPVLPFVDPNDVYGKARTSKTVDEHARLKNLVEDARISEGPEDIFGRVFDEMNCDSILDDSARSPVEWNEVLKQVVLARIAEPLSKLATSDYLKTVFGRDIPVHKIYRMLDRLGDAEDRAKLVISSHTQKVVGGKVDVLFFDVTTLYFESVEQDELRRFGFSKDCKFKETQVVLALVTTAEGLPIAYDLFPGNTFEGHTLLPIVKSFKTKYLVNDILLVADRGMFSEENLAEMDKEGVQYIVAAKLKTMKASTRNEILKNNDIFRPTICNDEFCWIAELTTAERRRLIVSYSSKRASKDQSDRQRLIERLIKKEKDGLIKTKDLIGNAGTKKFLKIRSGNAEINHEKIALEAEWDGIHGVITNISVDEAPATKIIERYRDLWRIEESFRINKHSLKMRPIYHWTPRRIRAHVSLCFIAYAVLRHTQHHLNQKGISLGVDSIRSAVNSVQASIIVDQSTGKRYGIPSKMSAEAADIYAAFSLRRCNTPFQL